MRFLMFLRDFNIKYSIIVIKKDVIVMNNALWIKAVEFHGHECPGLAIGVRVSDAAKEMLRIGSSEDEEIVCVAENDSCSVDAIQALLGCTFGKETFIQKYRKAGFFVF